MPGLFVLVVVSSAACSRGPLDKDPSVGETGLKDAGLPGTRQGLSTWIAINLDRTPGAKSIYFGREVQLQVNPVRHTEGRARIRYRQPPMRRSRWPGPSLCSGNASDHRGAREKRGETDCDFPKQPSLYWLSCSWVTPE